jgi:hypothetical protein
MRRIIKVFFLLTIGLLVSCSSDDSNESNSFKTDIVGTWEGFSATINGEEIIENGDCLDRVIFTSNTVESKEYYDYEDGAGCILDYESGPGTYAINGNMLTGTVDGETISFEILVLNATTLKIKGSVTEDGVTFTFIETFRRL